MMAVLGVVRLGWSGAGNQRLFVGRLACATRARALIHNQSHVIFRRQERVEPENQIGMPLNASHDTPLITQPPLRKSVPAYLE
jgi:hypothetical protein